MILNLKNCNDFVEKKSFKMETLVHIIALMTPNCYMTILDLCDTYLMILVAFPLRKYLKFQC